jgi:hypothetical protein
VAVVRDPAIASGIGQFAAIQAVAPALGVDLTPVDARDAPEIERAITAFARSGNAGLIVTASAVALRHRDLIVTLAARHGLPAVYTSGPYVAAGGLISYGTDLLDQYRITGNAGCCARACRGHEAAAPPRARARTPGGMASPSTAAVLRLMISSYLVGAWTGRSAGFSPLRSGLVMLI